MKKPIEEIILDWRSEITGYLEEMSKFSKIEDPTYIMKQLSSMGARVRYFQLVTSRSGNRVVKNFHYDEIVPFLKEVEMQFKIWSRVAALAKDEWEMTTR